MSEEEIRADERAKMMAAFEFFLAGVSLLQHAFHEGPFRAGFESCLEELETRLTGDPPMDITDLMEHYGHMSNTEDDSG